ncbi:MAG: orotate phosphoribosyltransferase [Eubacteriales bacterium]|nr:orotate phosphoribosyltransferase [Eubacteriales bacterium]
MNQSFSIVQALFDTKAIRVAPADQPFWYTSGTLGPYYINTHFLYGNEANANALLSEIEIAVKMPLELPHILTEMIMETYQQMPVFKAVIDSLIGALDGVEFDVVTGGERRDFFFSIPVAALLNKPHLTILKDGQAFWADKNGQNGHEVKANELNGQKALHIADLVTEASSYTRTWLPTLNRCGLSIDATAVVVDRDQGGREILEDAGVKLIALTKINEDLFKQAQLAGLISEQQLDQIIQFTQNPHHYMQAFFTAHPAFLNQQIAIGGKAEERARRCLEQGYGEI